MRPLLLVTFFFLILNNNWSQVSTRLVTITEGSPTNASGLGSTFDGKVLSDGNLYFQGSGNGLQSSIWKTDGTIEGTTMVIEEENEWGADWGSVFMTNAGVLFSDDGEHKLLEAGANDAKFISEIPEESIRQISQSSDGSYYLTTKRDDNLILHIANEDFDQVSEIGAFHANANFIKLSGGTKGAFIFDSNTFVEDTPSVYLSDTDEIILVEDYFPTLGLTISDLSYGYIYDKFLFASYRDADNIFRNKVINMETGTSADFKSIREPIEYYDYNGQVIMLTQREVISLNPDDLTFTELYGSVYPFTVSELAGDHLFVIGRENNIENIVQIDLLNQTANQLPDAVTGNSFYGNAFEFHKNELYYIADGDHQLLMKYDFESESPVFVDTLSMQTGATVIHALTEVQGRLVFSKRIGSLQHELYVLGSGLSSTKSPNIASMEVYPTLAENYITIKDNDFSFDQDSKAIIYNSNGQLINVLNVTDKQLNISRLLTGNYIGIIRSKGIHYQFQFVKN